MGILFALWVMGGVTPKAIVNETAAVIAGQLKAVFVANDMGLLATKVARRASYAALTTCNKNVTFPETGSGCPGQRPVPGPSTMAPQPQPRRTAGWPGLARTSRGVHGAWASPQCSRGVAATGCVAVLVSVFVAP